MIRLSKRLQAVADMASDAGGLIDVGTDHGYIPVYFAENGFRGRLVASDIRPGPLENARCSAREAGVADKIQFLLTPGLEGVDSEGLDTVVIAGMGGETMAQILSGAPWLREKKIRLVLEPQSKVGELSHWLEENGYAYTHGVLLEEDGKLYPVLRAETGFGEMAGSEAERMVPKVLWKEEKLEAYVAALARRQEAAVKGLRSSSGGREEELEAAQRLLDELREIIKE